MKKMNFTAVLVLMLSATSAFADETCSELLKQVNDSAASKVQYIQNIQILNERIPALEAERLNSIGKDDSLLIGGARAFSKNESFVLIKALADNQAGLRAETGRYNLRYTKYIEQCAHYERLN